MPREPRLRAVAGQSVQRLLYGSPPPEDGPFRRSVAWGDEGGVVVRDVIAAGDPCLVARLGSSELACVSFYTRWRLRRILPVPYPAGLRRVMSVNAGMFSVDDASLDRFSDLFLAAVTRADVMGVWFNGNEDRIVEGYCPSARLVHIESLNAAIRDEPWTSALEGRRVLVVHPFADTIERQYRQNRARLFRNPGTLPEFELTTLRAVQSAAGAESGFGSWFDALGSMREQIAAVDFDVAIIGAGAYGLPLAAAVKESGRQAVHLGGATQLLFGIIGRRWEVESPDDVATLLNEYWVRPSADERPHGADRVEGGCYW